VRHMYLEVYLESKWIVEIAASLIRNLTIYMKMYARKSSLSRVFYNDSGLSWEGPR